MAEWPSAQVKNGQPKSAISGAAEAPVSTVKPAPTNTRRRISSASSTRASAAPAAVRESLLLADLASAAEMWLLDGEARLSPKTVGDRRFLTDKLLWWLRKEGCKECGKRELMQFFAYLRVAHEAPEGRWGEPDKPARDPRAYEAMRPRTAANYFRWLRTFFLFCVADGTLHASPLRTLKPPMHRDDQIQPFTAKQIDALLQAAKQSRNAKRDEALVLLLLDTGARAAEICGLMVSDFNMKERSIKVLGKGSTHRTLYLTPRTTRAIVSYLRHETAEEDAPLFVAGANGAAGGALRPDGLGKIIRRLGKEAMLEGVRCSPHTFRHTFAVEFLRNGGGELTLQSLYGHTSLEMTRKYVNFANADHKVKHGQFSPVANMKLK